MALEIVNCNLTRGNYTNQKPFSCSSSSNNNTISSSTSSSSSSSSKRFVEPFKLEQFSMARIHKMSLRGPDFHIIVIIFITYFRSPHDAISFQSSFSFVPDHRRLSFQDNVRASQKLGGRYLVPRGCLKRTVLAIFCPALYPVLCARSADCGHACEVQFLPFNLSSKSPWGERERGRRGYTGDVAFDVARASLVSWWC